MSNNLPR